MQRTSEGRLLLRRAALLVLLAAVEGGAGGEGLDERRALGARGLGLGRLALVEELRVLLVDGAPVDRDLL